MASFRDVAELLTRSPTFIVREISHNAVNFRKKLHTCEVFQVDRLAAVAPGAWRHRVCYCCSVKRRFTSIDTLNAIWSGKYMNERGARHTMRREGTDLPGTWVSVVTSLVLRLASQKERRTDKAVPLSVAQIRLFGSDLITLAKQPGVRSNRCRRRRADEWRNKKQLVIHAAPNSCPNNTSRD